MVPENHVAREFCRLTLWQEMNTPHLLPLVGELANRFEKVRLVTLGEIEPVRSSIGWTDHVDTAIEHIHAPTRTTRAAAVRDSSGPRDLNLLQGLKPAVWQWQAQRALVASEAGIVVMSELHWPGKGSAQRMALNLRETTLARFWSLRAHALLALGEDAATHYIARGFPADRVHPFAYTPALSDVRPASITQGTPPVIAVAAKLEPYKGVDVLLRALAKLRDRPWHLKVAGNGSMLSELEGLAQLNGIAERVQWLGWQSAETIPQLFADASLAVLPSRFEGWGAVVNEALGVGTPMVVSRGAGAHAR